MQPSLVSHPKISSMETRHRRKSGSGEAFSFPVSTRVDDNNEEDFEFGCVTPESPSSDPSENSPADHLFLNGRLLPHSFPFRPNNGGVCSSSTSRTSSVSSKDSLMSSRSNSTNSSCSSSARTSSSDNSERRPSLHLKGGKTTSSYSYSVVMRSKAVSAQVYGSSQMWQFMAPVPALSRESSLRRRKPAEDNYSNHIDHDHDHQDRRSSSRPKKQKQDRTAVVKRQRLGRRIFRWFLSACKECHAIEPSKKDKILRENVKLQ